MDIETTGVIICVSIMIDTPLFLIAFMLYQILKAINRRPFAKNN